MSFSKPFEIFEQTYFDYYDKYLRNEVSIVEVLKGVINGLKVCSNGYSSDVESMLNLCVHGGFSVYIRLDGPIKKDRFELKCSFSKSVKDVSIAYFFHENKIDALVKLLEDCVKKIEKNENVIYNIEMSYRKRKSFRNEEIITKTIDIKIHCKLGHVYTIEISSDYFGNKYQNSYYTEVKILGLYPLTIDLIYQDILRKCCSYIFTDSKECSKRRFITYGKLPVISTNDVIPLIKYADDDTVFYIYEWINKRIEEHFKIMQISTLPILYKHGTVNEWTSWLFYALDGNVEKLINDIRKLIESNQTVRTMLYETFDTKGEDFEYRRISMITFEPQNFIPIIY